jgi:hypothetical protein
MILREQRAVGSADAVVALVRNIGTIARFPRPPRRTLRKQFGVATSKDLAGVINPQDASEYLSMTHGAYARKVVEMGSGFPPKIEVHPCVLSPQRAVRYPSPHSKEPAHVTSATVQQKHLPGLFLPDSPRFSQDDCH